MATPLRALVVEDSENDCMPLLSILRRGGYAGEHTRVAAASLKSALDDPLGFFHARFPWHRPRGGNELILVAENHDGMRDMAEQILGALGYACARTTSVLTTASEFRCSLMASPYDPCRDLRTRRQKVRITPRTRDSRPSVFVRSVSGREGTATPKPAQGGEDLQSNAKPARRRRPRTFTVLELLTPLPSRRSGARAALTFRATRLLAPHVRLQIFA
jgi:hypothetical protein